MRQLLIWMAIVFTLSACASSPSRAQRSEFEDIPVPKGLELDWSRSTVIESPTIKAARLFYKGRITPDSLAVAFRSTLEANGWRHLSPTTTDREEAGSSLVLHLGGSVGHADQRRNNEKMYDIFSTGMSLVPDPTQHPYLRCDWPGWTCDEEITSRMDAIRKEPDPKKRRALWEDVHRVFYERVPVIRYGDLFGLRAMQASVKGYNEKMAFPRFYNVWLDK